MIFQIISIIILLFFYICYFVKMLNQHKKGIQTNQLGKGKTGFIKFIELTLQFITCIVPVAEVISIIMNTVYFSLPVRIIGICISMTGVAVFVISVVTMQDNWRAGVSKNERTELVTSGIYQISRNPAFLGFDLVYIGMIMTFFNWLLFCVSFIAIVMLHLQIINVEEEFLLEVFGHEYLNYKKKVCRYIGRKH